MPGNILSFMLGVIMTAAVCYLSRSQRLESSAMRRRRSDLTARVSCPCCRYPTLFEKARDEICELCGWQDDGQDDKDAAEVWGGPNDDHSLITARASFREYRNTRAPTDERYHSPIEHDVKGLLMQVFDQLNECPEYEKEALRQTVNCLEGVLSAETSRRVAQIQASYRHDT